MLDPKSKGVVDHFHLKAFFGLSVKKGRRKSNEKEDHPKESSEDEGQVCRFRGDRGSLWPVHQFFGERITLVSGMRTARSGALAKTGKLLDMILSRSVEFLLFKEYPRSSGEIPDDHSHGHEGEGRFL